MKVEMPADLEEAVGALGIQVADWKTAFERQQARIYQLEQLLANQMSATNSPASVVAQPTEKSLGAKERNSLLTLVIGMAIKGYAHDPRKGRTSTATEIANDLALLGIPLSDDTTRAYLIEARDLLPPPETEQKR
jgi:hypothetical protein